MLSKEGTSSMIIRQTVNFVTHVIGGVAFATLAVLAMRGCRVGRSDTPREDWDDERDDRRPEPVVNGG